MKSLLGPLKTPAHLRRQCCPKNSLHGGSIPESWCFCGSSHLLYLIKECTSSPFFYSFYPPWSPPPHICMYIYTYILSHLALYGSESKRSITLDHSFVFSLILHAIFSFMNEKNLKNNANTFSHLGGRVYVN